MFYQLLAGSTNEERQRLRLGKAESFAMLSKSGCVAIDGVDDKHNYEMLKEAFRVLRCAKYSFLLFF